MGNAVTTKIELFPDQQECLDNVLAAYNQGRGKALVVACTGWGKTILFSFLIDWWLKQHVQTPVIIICNKDELLEQAREKLHMIDPTIIVGKVGGGIHDYGAPVTVASIDTISLPNHLKNLPKFGYGLAIYDECHRAVAPKYARVLEVLSDAFRLGVTATPNRLDQKPLEPLFGKPVFSMDIITAITKNRLCDVKAIAIRTETNLDDLRSSKNAEGDTDFNQHDLDLAVNTPSRNKRVVDAYQEHANGRKAICFTVTIAHAEALAYAFNDAGINADVISGNTSLEERKNLYKALRYGNIRILLSVAVLLEGFDEQSVDCVIWARPTQSQLLYIQGTGRGLRKFPGKQNCIVLDLTDNCLKHRLQPQSLRKVLNKHIKDNESILDALAREEQESLIVEKEKQIRKLPEKREKDLHVNLLEKLDWQERDGGMYVLEVGVMKHRIALIPAKEQDGLYHVYARLAPDFKPQCWLEGHPLDWAAQYAEKRARTILANAGDAKLVDKNAQWRRRPATPKQLAVLGRNHIPYSPFITNGEASDLLSKFFAQQEAKKAEKDKKKERISA